MNGALKTAKANLRSAVLARRDALSTAERASLSARITEKLLTLDSFQRAKTVMAYMSTGSEFETRTFVEHILAAGKTLVLPRVAGKRRLTLHRVSDLQTGLQAGVWGIREPVPGRTPEISVGELDWILVPGVAFSRTGARLGYGGGYYDILLASAPPAVARVAAAFSVQVVSPVPVSEHDQPVTQVITELA